MNVPGIVPAGIAGRVSIVIMGRYFSANDARHGKHQPTYRLQRLKERTHFGMPFVPALAKALRLIDSRNPAGCVTCVPARPARSGPPPFHEVVERACKNEAGRPRGLDFRPDLLRCTRDYEPQKLLSGESRCSNVRGAFALGADGLPEHVVLVDDIITTGSTATECAGMLIAGGARNVTIVCLGRTQGCIPRSTSVDAPGCSRAGCPGTLTKRLNHTTHDAFWGCSQYGDGRCKATRPWRDGLRAYNELNRSDAIEDWLDVPF